MTVAVATVAQTIERIAPTAWAEEWDNVGLLVGSGRKQVAKILVSLDGTLEVVQEAVDIGAQLIVAHHPIMFRPLKNLREDNPAAQIPLRLIQHDIAYYAAHTNLDQSVLSASWTLAESLGLAETELLAPVGQERLVKLVVFVPEPEAEAVRQALVRVGVGEGITDGPHAANYAESFFAAKGEGMFRPLAGAEPAIGRIGDFIRVEEVRLESIIPEFLAERAVRSMRKVHPYEEPAYDLIPLQNPGRSWGYGVLGRLKEGVPLGEFWRQILTAVNPYCAGEGQNITGARLAGDPRRLVKKIAVVNGSGSSFVGKALFKGVDLLVTGDIDHHAALDAVQGGMAIGDIGHFASEISMVHNLGKLLQNEKVLSGVQVQLSRVNKVPWV